MHALKVMKNNGTLLQLLKNSEELNKINMIASDPGTPENEKVVALEQLIIELKDEYLSLKPDKLFSIPLRDEEKNIVRSAVQKVEIVYEIRKAYKEHCFIGFVGPQNAGKSTLLNKLFNKEAKTGMRDHTSTPTIYEVGEKMFAIDYPGSDSLFDHAKAFMEFGFMNNMFIYVTEYRGTPNKELIENIKKAYKVEKMSGNSSRTLFCLNQCEKNDKSNNFDENYKREIIDFIRSNIEKSSFFEEDSDKALERLTEHESDHREFLSELKKDSEKLKAYTLNSLKEEDFIFTDWLAYGNRGIQGPEDVKKRLMEFAAMMK